MVRCDVWRQKGVERWRGTGVDRRMEELSINDEIGLMCGGVARGHGGGKGREWMDGGTGYKDECGEGEMDRWTVEG